MRAASLSSIRRKSRTSPLFAKHENASLSREANFLHLAVFADEHGIHRGLCGSVFPAPFAFGDRLPSLLHGRLGSIDQQAIFTCLQISLADLCRLGDVDGFADWFCEERHGRDQSGCQRHTAENRIEFHACQLPFRQDRVSLSCHKRNRVLTRVLRASSLTRKTPRSSWTNGRKDCVSSPRGCHRGVFVVIPLACLRSFTGLHLYRRTATSECFAGYRFFFLNL
jgi:hypothetical protein